jgi:hypothetical protein
VSETRFSDDLLRQYLLGELAENQQVEIEDRAFEDPKLLKSITALENDLIDEYVAGEIPVRKRERFETHFLAAAERKKKLAFARALHSVISNRQQQERRTAEYSSRPSFYDKLLAFLVRPATAYAFAATTLVLLGLGLWLAVYSFRLRSEVAHLQAAQESQASQQRQLEAEINNERKRNEELAAQLHQEPTPPQIPDQQKEPQPTEPTRSPILATLTLLPGLSRSGSAVPHLTLAKDVTEVRLRIGIDPRDEYKSFRVVVSEAGRPIASRDHLTARGSGASRAIPVNIPAKMMRSGRHEVALKGVTANGTTEDVGYYYFDVVKK